MNDSAPRAPKNRLAELPFFQGFDRAFLDAISENAVERNYDTGKEIVREGDPAHEFFVLLQGKVGLEIEQSDRPRRTIRTLGAGEVLGWSWLVPPYRYHFDARALKPTRVIALDARVIREVLQARPQDGFQFLTRLLPVIASRLESTQLQLLDLYGR
jgi:CRP-like cAMP-binding protein